MRLGGVSWPRLSVLRVVLLVHLVALVAIRLFTDADDFNNWDLISFQNANSFSSLSTLLRMPQVHLLNPFSFPAYNTGAESVLSILLHHAMSRVSLYWSNTVVVVFYDAILLVALCKLFRLVFADAFDEVAAWILVTMSSVVLTFASISAFDMQAFATITLALLGCERILQSRRRSGIVLLVVAFLCISQAYPLTFYLPLFCLVWTASRLMVGWSAPAAGRARNAVVVTATVLACTAVVELASGGAYLPKVFGVVAEPLSHNTGGAAGALEMRVPMFLREAVAPVRITLAPRIGFAPYFLWLSLLSVVALWLALRPCRDGSEGEAATRGQVDWVAVLGWTGLVVFGYLPALFGSNLKSQRCFFGDVFLAMAVAAAVGRLVRRREIARTTVLAMLLVVLGASDAFYVTSVLAVDHRQVHRPIFDYDEADGVSRHKLDDVLNRMRVQIVRDHAGLIVYYPSGWNENRTDPAMFYARFLRRVGPYQQRQNLIFPCHYCDIRYGCPFPDVGGRKCRSGCCYRDPLAIADQRPQLAGHKLFLWWYTDQEIEDEPRQSEMLASLKTRYEVTDLGWPARDRRWRCFALSPLAKSFPEKRGRGQMRHKPVR
jgi:hypothetical protein